MAIDPSDSKRKRLWVRVRAMGYEKPDPRDDDWGVTERDGYPPTLLTGDDFETPQRFRQRIEEAIETAYDSQEVCANCGGSGTVWHFEVQSWGMHAYKRLRSACFDCAVCNPGGFE